MKWLVLSLWLCAGACFAQANPIVKTVKPAGGGDFTTLQAWADWADDQTSGYQWAECYAGNLGPLVFSTWSNSPTAERPARIYVPIAQRSNGTLAGSWGAYSTQGTYYNIYNDCVPYVSIIGLYMRNTYNMQGTACVALRRGAIGFRMASCLVTYSNVASYASNPGTCLSVYSMASNLAAPVVVANNIFIGSTKGIHSDYSFCNGAFFNIKNSNAVVCVNNVSINMTNRRGGNKGFGATRTTLARLTMVNNFSANDSQASNNRAADFGFTGLSRTNMVFKYNVSFDASATNYDTKFGGLGSRVGVRSSNVLADVWTDWRLRTTNALVDVGTKDTYSDDLFKASTWRPRGGGIDVGAQEQTNHPNVANFESLLTSPDAGEAVYFP